jgi:hypothetical protein
MFKKLKTTLGLAPETKPNYHQAIEQRLALFEQDLKLMEVARSVDDTACHARIALANKRMEHIEHYLGMRFHPFEMGERMWDFNQVAKSIKSDEKPKSRFTKKISNNPRRSK